VVTLADVAREIYRSEGKSVRVLPVPMPLAGLGLTVAEYLPVVPMGRDQYRSLRFDNTTEDNDIRVFGVEGDDLRALDAYLAGETGRGEGETPVEIPGNAVDV